ncbi:chromosome segregation protein SMC [Candidatus Parcubacteria bacterium]|nr:chromosome segregation protein SMC [Candidatus Parcubacteria bacterium]
MYLEKIEIQGFKSFANKTTLIFPEPQKNNKGITAVVGPNGSGKSNISDAVRWVLGEQSSKLLRGKKSQDVIFHGTGKRARLGMAEVSLYINNNDKIMPIDYSEAVLTRRLYRNGESEYLINKNRTRLNEIIMLLAKANFGQRSYSIIGQGMIDSILQASAKERKDFFNEAAGVKQYHIKKEQAINNLEKTAANLTQTKITLSELEPRLKYLTRQSKKLEKRQAIKKELTDLQIAYYSDFYFNLQNRINTDITILKKKQDYKQSLDRQFAGIQEKLASFAKQEESTAGFDKIKDELNSYQNQKNKLFGEIAVLKAEIDVEYKKAGKFDLAWLEKNRNSIKEQCLKEEQDCARYKVLEAEIKEELQKYSNKNLEFDGKLSKIKDRLQKFSVDCINNRPKELRDLLRPIIKSQEKLVELIIRAKDIKDIQKIKQSALAVKNSLSGLIEEDDKSGQDRFEKEIFALTKKQEELSELKNEYLGEIGKLKIKQEINIAQTKIASDNHDNLKRDLQKITAEIKESTKKPLSRSGKLEDYNDKKEKLYSQIIEINKKIEKFETEISLFNRREQEEREEIFLLQDTMQKQQLKINEINSSISSAMVGLAKLEANKENLEDEIKEELGGTEMLKKEKAKEFFDKEKIQKFKKQLELIGGIDAETIKELEETEKRFNFLSSQCEDSEKASIKLRSVIENLDKIIKVKFNDSFEKINGKFNKYFKILFNGGETKLIKNIIIDETEDGSEQKVEIEIQAAPPGKKLKDINILSGGEKALTSIALVCAIISINPSPFVVLDEVDAALDESNSVRFAKIIKNLTSKTQFIAITHNRATMEIAEVLYGITMQDSGISKVLSMKLEDAAV